MTTRNNVITIDEARRRAAKIPPIWDKVFGMMKGKRRVDPVKVQRRLRTETGKRLRRQVRLGRKRHVA